MNTTDKSDGSSDVTWLGVPDLAIKHDDSLRGASDGSDGVFSRSPTSFGDLLWDLGWTDGRVDQSFEHGMKILATRAQLEYIAVDLDLKKKAMRLRELTDNLEQREADALKRLNSAETALDDLEDKKRESPGQFSVANGLINIGVALSALLADIPLSLKLVAAGFGVRTSDASDENFSVDAIVVQPWQVFQHFWEAILLCIGVAMLGMFFKLICEDLLDAANKSKIWLRFYRGFVLFIGLLLMVTIFYLGILRSQVNKVKRADSIAELREDGNGAPSSGAAVDEDVQLSAELPSFILLAVIFPIVGGVSFAVGWRKCQSFFLLKKTTDKVAEIQGQLQGIRQDLAQSRAEAMTWEASSAQEVAKRVQDFWQQLYAHGYERGRHVPETLNNNAPIHERFERNFHRLLAAVMR